MGFRCSRSRINQLFCKAGQIKIQENFDHLRNVFNKISKLNDKHKLSFDNRLSVIPGVTGIRKFPTFIGI